VDYSVASAPSPSVMEVAAAPAARALSYSTSGGYTPSRAAPAPSYTAVPAPSASSVAEVAAAPAGRKLNYGRPAYDPKARVAAVPYTPTLTPSTLNPQPYL